jgi:amino acid transporter
MNSYRLGSFNQVYPIARGTSPLVVAAGAYLVVSERLGAVPLAGVAILAFGLMSLALSAGRLARPDLPAVGVAVLTGLRALAAPARCRSGPSPRAGPPARGER